GDNRYLYVLNRPVQGGDPSGLWGPDVHDKCTERWARETHIWIGSPCCKFLVFDNPRFIAAGDQGQDDPKEAAVAAYNWYIHFNYMDWRDWLRVLRGQSLRGNPDTREMNLREKTSRAIQLARRNWCDAAMLEFGKGMHSMQDIFSHADLTPWEHRDAINHPYVDDPNCDRGRQLARTGYCDACIPWACNPSIQVRRFEFFPGRKRIKATEKRSRRVLEDFLTQIKNT